MTDAQRLERIEATIRGMLWQYRQTLNRVKVLEQAILELDAALRRSGITPEVLGSLPPPPRLVPDRQSADEEPKIPA